MSHLRHSSRLKSMYARRNKTHNGISLVSMMDIFTILVFFLLVNSESEVLPSSAAIKLPESVAEKKPKDTLVVIVNDKDVLVQNQTVASVRQVMENEDSTIPALAQELDYQLKRQLATHDPDKPFKGQIMIMGDKKIPYKLLKKIMLTCSQSKYSHISLAVMQRNKEKG